MLIHPERGHPLPGRACGRSGLRDRLPGRQAECFGVVPAVVLGEHLAEAARPVGNGAVADLATRDWKAGNGHRKAAGI